MHDETPDTQRLKESCEALKAHFNLQPTGQIDFDLEQFHVFKPYVNVSLAASYVIKRDINNDCYILFLEARANKKQAKSFKEHSACQAWALAYLKQDFGRVLIRRETLADKIIELVHPIELDFEEDIPFSDTFYVLTDDLDKAKRCIDRDFRNAVMDIREDGLVVEVVNHTLIIGSTTPVVPEKVVYMARFVDRLCLSC